MICVIIDLLVVAAVSFSFNQITEPISTAGGRSHCEKFVFARVRDEIFVGILDPVINTVIEYVAMI